MCLYHLLFAALLIVPAVWFAACGSWKNAVIVLGVGVLIADHERKD